MVQSLFCFGQAFTAKSSAVDKIRSTWAIQGRQAGSSSNLGFLDIHGTIIAMNVSLNNHYLSNVNDKTKQTFFIRTNWKTKSDLDLFWNVPFSIGQC